MQLDFRQGLVRYQSDLLNNPTFLQFTPAGVTLNVSPDPTVITFAHGLSDYLFEEPVTIVNAWPGPFDPVDQWLYWDLDLITGERTFGITKFQPIDSVTQPQSVVDQHWFDFSTNQMKVFTGARFVEKIRVFAAKLEGGGFLVPFPLGTQVGLNVSSRAGVILFDEDDKAVKKFDRFGRGAFITTETFLSSQFSRLVNFRLESEIQDAKAIEHIPSFFCVAYIGVNQIGLASHTVPEFPCVGIASEEMFTSEVRKFILRGFIKNELWDWTGPPGTKLFVGPTGELSTTVPQSTSIQCVASIVSPKTILVNINQPILLT